MALMAAEKSGAGQRRASLLGILVALALTVGLTLLLHVRAGLTQAAPARSPIPVAVTPFQLQDSYQRSVSYLGLVRAGNKAELGFELPGLVAALEVREGSQVRAGDILATLDTATLQARRKATAAQLQQARSELELAQLKAQRQRDLRESGAVSREAYDETRLRAEALAAQVDAVSAQLDSIDIELDKSALQAPYDGVVAGRYIDAGTVVSAGTPVLRLVSTGGREAHIGIAIEQAAKLVPGEQYQLKLRSQDIDATLRSVRPDVDPVTRATTAVFALPEDTLALDGEAISLAVTETVPISGGWLPIAALLEGQRGIWNVLVVSEAGGEGQVTAREAVEVLELQGDRAYVRGSLEQGHLVVADGTHRIAAGAAVTIAGH